MEEDIENRFGFFKGGRYTDVNKVLSLIIALIITGLFFAVIVFFLAPRPGLAAFTTPLIRSGNTFFTGPCVFLSFWTLVILALKWKKLGFQAKALDLSAVPQQADFVLTEESAKTVLQRIHNLVDHPRHFILFNRIERALSNLSHLGGVTEVATIIKGQGENDENQVASSYTMINGLVWAVPVIGFIGTVSGLSVAIGNFSKTLADAGDLASIKANLQGVTAGLSTAFETTFVALILALIIQLSITFMQQKETAFLDECNDYCHSNVIAKLRSILRGNSGDA
ncbi:MotA/TolQ/ExbB proton channel family protein [Verrucomicrobia bacterium]|nr:MotA/TolQ/ExbB proton channel family protein [Verrucomicrobiota bacterium]